MIDFTNVYQFTLFNLVMMLFLTMAIGVIIGQMPRARKWFAIIFAAAVVYMTLTLWGEGKFQK